MDQKDCYNKIGGKKDDLWTYYDLDWTCHVYMCSERV